MPEIAQGSGYAVYSLIYPLSSKFSLLYDLDIPWTLVSENLQKHQKKEGVGMCNESSLPIRSNDLDNRLTLGSGNLQNPDKRKDLRYVISDKKNTETWLRCVFIDLSAF